MREKNEEDFMDEPLKLMSGQSTMTKEEETEHSKGSNALSLRLRK